MSNETIRKFGYPASLLREYENWVVLLRPEQVTVGSLVLACKGEITRMSDVSASAFAELAKVVSDLENTLKGLFSYDKINYLLLMMVDNHVHFHVLPRYSSKRDVTGVEFTDVSWPGPPDLSKVASITPEQQASLLNLIKGKWPKD